VSAVRKPSFNCEFERASVVEIRPSPLLSRLLKLELVLCVPLVPCMPVVSLAVASADAPVSTIPANMYLIMAISPPVQNRLDEPHRRNRGRPFL
jgi:hypothetical protein